MSPLKKQEFSRDDVEFVRIGYNDACTNFTVRFHRHDLDTFKKAVRAAGQYNAFEPTNVLKAFAKIEKLVDQVSFGREGSPVMYIEVRPIFEDRDGKYEINPTATESNIEKIMEVFRAEEVATDEIHKQGERTIRLWWD